MVGVLCPSQGLGGETDGIVETTFGAGRKGRKDEQGTFDDKSKHSQQLVHSQ